MKNKSIDDISSQDSNRTYINSPELVADLTNTDYLTHHPVRKNCFVFVLAHVAK